MNKDTFGYKTTEPCCVCGQINNNQIEPRFNYVVCENHQHLKPVDIFTHKIFKKHQNEEKTGRRH